MSYFFVFSLNRTSEHTPEHEQTPKSKYFDDWYNSEDETSPEEEIQLFEQIRQMPDDNSLLVRRKNGYKVVASNLPWVQKGPSGILYNEGLQLYYAGRVNALAYHSSGDLYVGAANGGLWKSAFITLVNKSDEVPSLRIGSVAVVPSDENHIFLGTGDYDDGLNGAGLFHSTDKGETWNKLELTPKNPRRVSQILIFGTNVLVGSDRGIYLSTDLGNSWSRTLDSNVCSMSMAEDESYILAGVNGRGVWKSTTQGTTWGKIWSKKFPSLDSSNLGRISVAVSQSQPSRAYVQVGNPGSANPLGLYKTTNSGNTWSMITTPSTDYLGQQSYNNVLLVHPTNPDIVWAGGLSLWRTSDG
ncbi:MAG: exo-alpha-sialidase, partial [Ignavibacteriales bacterium]|nr:exo-alpha-sialidase [Ignavibacteriales bacterium]